MSQTQAVSYPLVGAQPVEDAAAQAYHGRWHVLDASGRLLPEGGPELANVSVTLRFGYLVLQAPGMLRLDIPLGVIEDDPSALRMVRADGKEIRVADEGAWAAEWFSQVLGQPVRLVKICEPVVG
ncbi:MOSC N-terminal beta barrel domain-containing protein [Achromobacter sp. F4_2707]|uniref:MOSC N-terminal beta barrel domain-containing protein n=1 Tax=Achromobacter sp. F4_2707 TaxID=3114286 RepID=UPI0039C5ECB0